MCGELGWGSVCMVGVGANHVNKKRGGHAPVWPVEAQKVHDGPGQARRRTEEVQGRMHRVTAGRRPGEACADCGSGQLWALRALGGLAERPKRVKRMVQRDSVRAAVEV